LHEWCDFVVEMYPDGRARRSSRDAEILLEQLTSEDNAEFLAFGMQKRGSRKTVVEFIEGFICSLLSQSLTATRLTA
jgi:hypothetical protein